MKDENFFKEFESKKIKSWNEKYINYVILLNKITTILENDNNENQLIDNKDNEEITNEENLEDNNKSEIELDTSGLNTLANNLIKNDKEKVNPIRSLTINETMYKNDMHKDNLSKENLNRIKLFKKPTKEFMSLLDNEIKKIHIFYTSKETYLYENLNSQISVYNNPQIKDNNPKKMEIIDDLSYMSQLCKSLINYVYLNIKVLIRILNIYDIKVIGVQYISFDFIKKYLSKNNGDLVYLLKFKILDESISAIEILFQKIKNDLESNYFKNNEKEKDKFNNFNEILMKNIKEIEKVYGEIFEELKPWEKYLNISLALPTSTYHSVFVNTSFIADSIPMSKLGSEKKKTKKRSKTSPIINSNVEYLLNIDDNIDNNEKNNLIDNNDDKQKKEENNNKKYISQTDLEVEKGFGNSDLFNKSEIFSYKSNKVLSRSNLYNLGLLVLFGFFFSFSISILLPKMIIVINDYKLGDNLFLYGIVLSIPSIGNLLAKFIYLFLAKKFSFKVILAISSFFLIIYYFLLFIGLFLKDIIYIIIGRFILGFSFLKHLSKIYVDKFVPLSNQIKLNQRYKKVINIGFGIGLLSNSLYIFNDKLKIYYFEFSYLEITLIIISIALFLPFYLILILFDEPTENQLLTEALIEMNNRHRLSRGIIDLIDNKIAEFHDRFYFKANNDVVLSQTNVLSNFVQNQIEKKKCFYNKISFILLSLLFSSEYTRENLLLFIPRLINYQKYNIIFGPIIISSSFFVSFFIKKCILNKKTKIQRERYYVLIISFILLLLNGFFIFIIIPDKDNIIKMEILPGIGIFCMILFNEIYNDIIINLFIKLLPSEDLKFCCFKIASIINILTKLTKFIPSLIIFLSYFYYIKCKGIFESIIELKYEKKFNILDSVLFGIQVFNFMFCFFLCLFNLSSLRVGSKNRLLYQR